MKQKLNQFLTRNLSENQVDLEIDLRAIFPSKKFSEKEKEVIAQVFIDKIVERAEQRQVDIEGRKFQPYSESYKSSKEFKAFGKSDSNRNMKLTGDLLGQIETTDIGEDTVKVGWSDDLQNAKAHGNITGQNGLWENKRDFFGLSVSDIKEVKAEIKKLIDG